MGADVPHREIVFPLHLAGSAAWFAALNKAAEHAIIDLGERFEKQTERSRFYLLGPNGKMCLSFPLNHGEARKKSVRAQELSEEKKWKRQHWQSIKSCLGSSAFYIHYADELEELFMREHLLLSNLSLDLLSFCCKHLQITSDYRISFDYLENIPAENDLRNREFTVQNFSPYIQVFSDRFDFSPKLSVLDMIFNLGPEAAHRIRTLDYSLSSSFGC